MEHDAKTVPTHFANGSKVPDSAYVNEAGELLVYRINGNWDVYGIDDDGQVTKYLRTDWRS